MIDLTGEAPLVNAVARKRAGESVGALVTNAIKDGEKGKLFSHPFPPSDGSCHADEGSILHINDLALEWSTAVTIPAIRAFAGDASRNRSQMLPSSA